MYSLSSKDNRPRYVLDLDTLMLFNNYNQIIFHETKGEFDLLENRFYGSGGYLGWERIGIPIQNRRVFLSSFELF